MTSENYVDDAGTKTKVNAFTVTTLHEIGHAVDDRLHFMDGHLGDAKYGGWAKEDGGAVFNRVVAETGFFTDWQDRYPRTGLMLLLQSVVSTGRVDTATWRAMAAAAATPGVVPEAAAMLADPGIAQARTDYDAYTVGAWPVDVSAPMQAAKALCRIQHISTQVCDSVIARVYLEKITAARAVDDFRADMARIAAEPTADDLDAIKRHRAVDTLQAIRCTGNNGLWDKGASAADKYKIGGRVYQQSYAGNQWSSYPLAVRARGISQYQFRAAGEWFAELYALYYLKKLPPTHPDAVWFKAEIDTVAPPGAP
jgi:hypothetical protein